MGHFERRGNGEEASARFTSCSLLLGQSSTKSKESLTPVVANKFYNDDDDDDKECALAGLCSSFISCFTGNIRAWARADDATSYEAIPVLL